MKPPPALAARLAKAEAELAQLEAAPAPKSPKLMPGVIMDEYKAWVRDLETILSPEGLDKGLVTDRDIARARAQLKRRLGGHIVVVETDREIRFQTEAGAEEMALNLAGSGSQVCLVAGARYQRYLALVTALDVAGVNALGPVGVSVSRQQLRSITPRHADRNRPG